MGNKLFIYGTLADPEIQQRVLGRIIKGVPDSVKRYKKSEIEINKEKYPLIIPADESQKVEGLVIDLSERELKKADKYETSAYKRIKISLESGKSAWVYIKK